jgi:2-alkyl-3-oxoalkanoate reductase
VTAKKLRSALVGCGRISAFHVAALEALPDVEIVAACDLREQLASELASRNGIPHVFTDMEAMMRAVGPDVVHIITPPQSHLMLANIAARHGAHAYIEKPLAASRADAETILATARSEGVQVCAGHSRLFDPPFQEACRRMGADEIGQLVSVRAEQGFTYEPGARAAMIPWDHTYDWGIFENLMPHPLSLLCRLLHDPGDPSVVGLNVGRVREAAVEEVRVIIPAANALGELSFSLATPEANRLELVGTTGRILVDFDAMIVLSWGENGLPTAVNRFGRNFVTAAKLADASAAVAAGLVTGRIKRYMGIRALVAAFYQSLSSGAPMPVAPEEALVNVSLMEQIREACRHLAKRRVASGRVQGRDAAAPRVLVTGASGYLGGRLVERLARDRVSVRATTRLLSRANELPEVEWVQCDLTRRDEVERAVSSVEAVFHCAAMAGPPGSLEEYERANVDATLMLAEAAAEAGVEKLIYVSSLSVYGAPPPGVELVDEATPYDERGTDRGVYTQTKLRAELALLELIRKRGRPRLVVLRPGAIYGPGAALPVGLFQLPSTHRRPLVTGSRRIPVPLIYVDNLVDAMIAALERDLPACSVYDVVDSPDVDQGEIDGELRRLSGGRIRPVFVPYALAWGMMLLVDVAYVLRQGRMGTARYRLKRTLAPMRFRCTRAHEELGWEPRVSIREGLARTLGPTQ